MNREEKNYFAEILALKNPEWVPELNYEEYSETCRVYCEVRNLARDALLYPNGNAWDIRKIIEERLKRGK